MGRCGLEVANVFHLYGEGYRERHGASAAHRRVMTAIELCRTAALGGHVERCDDCGHKRVSYNSCRDRHCPKCQSLARAEWLDSASPRYSTPITTMSFLPSLSASL